MTQVFHLLLGEFAFAPLESQSELFQPLQYSVQSLQVLFHGGAGHLQIIQVDDHALDALQNLFHTLLEEAWSRGHAKGETQVPIEHFVRVDGEFLHLHLVVCVAEVEGREELAPQKVWQTNPLALGVGTCPPAVED